MAEPLRTGPLSEMGFPAPTAGAETGRPGPTPVTSSSTRGEFAGSRPTSEQPWDNQSLDNQSLGKKLNELGTEAEQVASQVREVVDQVVEQAKRTAGELAGDLKDRFDDVRGRIESGELEDDLREKAAYVTDQAAEKVREARRAVHFYSQKYPLQFIAGCAVAGFAVGFLIRMWGDE